MKCEYCENVREIDGDDVIVAVDMYKIGGKVVYCCSDCLEDNVPKDDRVPFDLPDGWSVIDDSKLANYEEQYRALMNVTVEIDKAEGVVNDNRYYPHPAGKLKENFDRLNSQIESLNLRFKQLGILHPNANTFGDNMLMPSGRRCPDCGGPLLSMRSVKDKHALTDPVFRQDHYRHSKVCLGCCLVFTGRKIAND